MRLKTPDCTKNHLCRMIVGSSLAVMLVAASVAHAEERADTHRTESKMDFTSRLQDFSSRVSDVLFRSMSFLGLPYKYGGSSPETGFDCSGLVRWVFGEALGMNLPRRAEEISRVGTPVSIDQLKPGDLVFYNTLRRTFSHVGIYLGNNRFIHAPSSGGGVRIDEITTPYWSQRFNGARRVVPPEASQEEADRAAAALAGVAGGFNPK